MAVLYSSNFIFSGVFSLRFGILQAERLRRTEVRRLREVDPKALIWVPPEMSNGVGKELNVVTIEKTKKKGNKSSKK